MKKGETSDAQSVANKYLEAFEKGNFKQMRSLLADRGKYGAAKLSADAFIETVRKAASWKDITVIKAIYSDSDAALLYEGTNTQTGQRMQATEFFEIKNGQIQNVRGSILVLAGALADVRGFAMAAMAVAI